ncbi:MAG: hypothetical protein Q4D98_02215 [Planctomycetia bacterium]|nr:hypothetical protein [Planctomycetia bacterium]
MSIFRKTCWLPLFCLSVLAFGEEGSVVIPEPWEKVFLEKLLERGEYRLAEKHCRERMTRKDSPTMAVEMAVELLRVLAEKSLASPPSSREEPWKQAEEIYTKFQKDFPHNLGRALMDYQWGVAILARARQQFFEETTPDDARAKIREAIRIFRSVDTRLQTIPQEIPRRKSHGSRTSDDVELSVWEIVSLQNKTRFQLLVALLFQGETYPAESMDRINAIQQALAQAQLLHGIPGDSPLVWDARLAEAVCYRLLGDTESCRKRLEAMELHPQSEPMALRIAAEKLRLWTLEKRYATAQEFLKNSFAEDVFGQCGELDLAILELFLRLWEKAVEEKDEDATKQGHTDVMAVLDQIRKNDTPRWVRQAERLLAQAMEQQGNSGDLSLLMLAADSACRTGDLEKAALACEKAWTRAVALKDAPNAVLVGSQLAAILYQQNQINESLAWFRKISITFPEQTDAMKNHHVAVALAAQLLNDAVDAAPFQKTSEPLEKAMETYEAVLVEHYRYFGKSDPNILDVLEKLEKLSRIRKKANETVDIAMIRAARIPTDDPRHTEAVRSALRAWEEYLTQLATQQAESPDTFRRAVRGAIQWAEKQPLPPEETLRPVRWRLDYLPETATHAEKWLRKRLDDATLSGEIRTEAQCLLVLTLVSQGREAEIAPLLEKLTQVGGSGHAQTLDAIFRKLYELFRKRTTEDSRKKVAQLLLVVWTALQKEATTFPEKVWNERQRMASEALLAVGRTDEAFQEYEQLAQKYPKRRDIQLAWSRILSDEAIRGKNPDLLSRAQSQWRDVEKHSPTQSDDWWEAKYHLALLYDALGQPEKATRMVQTLHVLHPGMGGKNFSGKWQKWLQAPPTTSPK